MDFRSSYKIGEGGTWVSVNPPTPAKPIPLRPRAIPIDRLGNTNWLRSMGIPAHYLQGNPGSSLIANGEVSQLNSMGAPAESFQESSSVSNGGISHLNSINLVNQHTEVNTWESMAARDRGSNHITAALRQQQPVLRLNSIDLAYQLGELHSLDADPSGRNRASGNITAGPQPQNLPASNGGLSRSNSINLTAQQGQLNSWDASMIGRDTTASRPRNPLASNGGVTRLHSINYTDQQQELNSWDAALIGRDRGSGPITTAGSQRQVMSNGATGWNNIPFSHLLALADAASETSTHGNQGGSYSSAARNFFPLSSAPIENNHQQSNSVTMLLKNQSAMLQNQNNTICSNQRRKSNAPPQMSQYGFPVPYHATYEPRTIADAASNGSISFQFDPITPNKGRNENNNQPPEMSSNFLDERLHQERNMLQDGVDHLREKTVDQHCQEAQLQSEVHSSPIAPELLSQPAKDTTCAPLSVTLEENHNHEKGEGNGFDLNKTPQQKPKRKKIRPRVVREGKPKKTPKSTEKQGIPKENQPAKRKYVRKNGTKAQHTQPINAGEEIPNTSTASKSCKRTLHFNLEGQEERTTVGHLEGEIQSNLDSMPRRVTFNTISESHSQELHSRNNDTSGNKSTIHIGHGFEVIVNNSPGGIAFDLNQSLNQILEEYISLPDMANPNTPPVRSDPSRERDGMGIASDSNNNTNTVSEAASNSFFQAESVRTSDNAVISSQSNHLVPRSWENSNCDHYQPLAEGDRQMAPKRALSHIHEAPVLDLIGEHIDSVPIYKNILPRNDEYMQSSNGGSLFPESSKKRRIGKNQKTVLSPSKAIAGDGSTQKDTATEPFTPQKGYNRCWNSQFPNASSAKNLRNGASNAVHGHHSQSPATGQMHHTNVPSDTLSCQEMSSGVMINIVQNSEFMLTPGQTERIPKKRSKGATRVRDFESLTAVSGCSSLTSAQWTLLSGSKQQAEICHRPQLYLEATPHDKGARGEKYKFNDERLVISNSKSHSSKNEVWLQENQAMVCSYLHSSPKKRGRPKGSSNLNSPPKQRGSHEMVHSINSVIDEITWKLGNLNITSASNTVLGSEQNALVPYMGENQMVLFDSTKKRKPRAKVDLDPETDRVWKLLMGKESGIDDEGTDAEKQRWWEEERRIFRGRADSFIARMHLIQGDRRFSKWTGSVVDSVVGVFLTQNVSDHLSSSAFMSLAAHFPIKSTRNSRAGDEAYMYVEEPEVSIVENREIGNSNESFGSNAGGGSVIEVTKCTELFACESTPDMCHESSKNRAKIQSLGAECPGSIEEDDKRSLEVQSSIVSSQDSADSSIQITTVRTTKVGTGLSEGDERGALDDFVSSQNSGNSSVAHTDDLLKSCSDSNSEEDLPTGSKFNSFNTTYTKLLQMAGTPMFQEYYNHGSLSLSSDLHSEIICKQSEAKKYDERELTLNKMNGKGDSYTISSLSEPHPTQTTINPSCKFSLCVTPNSGILEVECPEVIAADTFSLPPAAESAKIKEVDNASQRNGTVPDIFSAIAGQQKTAHLLSNSLGERNEAFKSQGSPPTDPKTHDRVLMERRNNAVEQANSCSSNPLGETLDAAESVVLVNQQNTKENTVAESNMKEQVYSSDRVSNDTATKAGNAKPKPEKEKRKEFDWDSLRKEAYQRCGKREWSHDTMDSLDWEAVRSADVSEIAKTIKERGMNNMLAERIKDFLNRLVREHESIDLEWLRDVPPDKAKEYLLSVRGLGLKSVECVRLLTLHHLAFPVDTNVGRIAVRLGWVPLQPLPESLQLHLLELYPIQESIQKYLWPRLCTLDQPTLYELHYQLITFGKVFCTKSKPNCNACPMRAECKHFASAFASARLTLPGPEEKGIVSSTTPVVDSQSSTVHPNPMSLPPPETSTNPSSDVHTNPMSLPPLETSTSETRSKIGNCQSIIDVPVSPNMLSETRSKISDTQPIIEVPASPEPECTEIQESDIEDAFYEDPDEIPTIELNIKDFATNLQNYMQQNNMELQEVDMSMALVALTPEAASIPTPKLKNVSRLRTEHQVYELPDSHPLLVGVEKRVPGEVCSYLLAIWTPGETAESTQPPQRCCGSQTSDNLCNEKTCFSCNSIREANSQTVRGTLLIPCKTAMRGSFPLNGTYFQVNEVFADHDSSLNPIDVPRNWLWNLPRRTVFFGTSVPSIFKGLRTEEIQSCFWRGYVCVRGFDQKTRAPRPLMARLHFPASRLISALRQKQEELKGRQQK